jgi:predicted DNA-binding protein
MLGGIYMETRVVSIRLGVELHDEIKAIAEMEKRATAQQIAYFIEKGLERYYAENRYLKEMEGNPPPNDERMAK